jgi:hypothetical protein
MTGNGFQTTYKNMVMTGGWFMVLFLPTLVYHHFPFRTSHLKWPQVGRSPATP